MPSYPKFHILELAQAGFERVSKFSNGKPRVFYRWRHLSTAGARRGHHREFCVHNDSFVLGELKKGRTIIAISCNCDLLNLVLDGAPESLSFLQRCNGSSITWAYRLRQREHCRATLKSCSTIH
jgi:hypothetical protein